MYVLFENLNSGTKQIDVRKFIKDFPIVTLINSDTFAEWPQQIVWNPDKLLHSDYYDDVLFI